MNKTCLSYWFPKLFARHIQVPRTEIMHMKPAERKAIWQVLDGKPMGEAAEPFFACLQDLTDAMGYPCFLRTGQGSGKHNWKNCCFLRNADSLKAHVVNLIEWSETVDFLGLPSDVWVVRELLPTKPICVLPAYGDFPLVPEVRCFIEGGKVSCWHPYWPRDSIAEGFREPPENLDELVKKADNLNVAEFMPLAERVAKLFADDGYWSVDILPTDRGWFVTDLAEGEISYHWSNCKVHSERLTK